MVRTKLTHNMYIPVWKFNSYKVRIKQTEEKCMRPEKNMMRTHTHAKRQFKKQIAS